MEVVGLKGSGKLDGCKPASVKLGSARVKGEYGGILSFIEYKSDVNGVIGGSPRIEAGIADSKMLSLSNDLAEVVSESGDRVYDKGEGGPMSSCNGRG